MDGTFSVDKLNGRNGFLLNGLADFDWAGFSVSSAGDVNGDGIADLLIGATKADSNGGNSGTSYVVFGNPGLGRDISVDLNTLDGTNGFQIIGAASSDQSGWSVASAGDANHDGYGDIIIGAYLSDPNGLTSAGSSYLVFGRANFTASSGVVELAHLNGHDGIVIQGVARNDYSGYAVNGAGDFNNDGFDDVIIGAYRADLNGNDSGVTYIVYGQANLTSPIQLSRLTPNTGLVIHGVGTGDQSGYSVSRAGDVNHDGISDVIIGAPGASMSYVVFGGNYSSNSLQLSDLNGRNGFSIVGENTNDQSGFSVSGVDDINQDGIDDVIIGSPYANPHGKAQAGMSYVVFGRSNTSSTVYLSALNGTNGFSLYGANAGDQSGFSVSRAGDVNRDRMTDLLIGAKGVNSARGSSYVVFGKPGIGADSVIELSNLNGQNGFAISGDQAGEESGYSVSAIGDINADEKDDIIIGAYKANGDGGTESGQIFIITCSSDVMTFWPTSQPTQPSSLPTGLPTSAPSAIPTSFPTKPFICAKDGDMNFSELNGNNGFTLNGYQAGDHMGWSLASAGDINGDGVEDAIIGVPNAIPNGQGSGSAYLVFGHHDFPTLLNINLNELNSLATNLTGTVINGMNPYDHTGWSVASAGDINHDGKVDIIIRATSSST